MRNKNVRAIAGLSMLGLSVAVFGNMTTVLATETVKEQESKVAEIVESCVVTEVLEMGEAITAIRVEYPDEVYGYEISPSIGRATIDVYGVGGRYEVTRVYASKTGVKGEAAQQGKYVFIEFSRNDAVSNQCNDGVCFDANRKVREHQVVYFSQNCDVTTADGYVIPAGYYNTGDNEIRMGVDDFEAIPWTDEETGSQLQILLYTPENYDGSEAFPLAVHFGNPGDSTYEDYSKEYKSALYTHQDCVAWAEPDNQKEHPGFVMTLGYDSSVELDASLQMRAVRYILDQYNIDENRIYCIGMAGSTRRAFQAILEEPDFFAAAVFVSYDPRHVYDNDEDAIKYYQDIASLMPTWEFAGFADTTGAGGAFGKETFVGKGERLAYLGHLLNDEYGCNFEIADGDLSWNGYLRGEAARKEAEAQVERAEAAGTDDLITIFAAGTLYHHDHCAWQAAFTNAGVQNWLFSQSK